MFKGSRLSDIEGSWIQGKENLEEGKYLLDFFSYSCPDCKQKKRLLSQLEEEIKVIRVHTPDFGFEEDNENLKEAIDRNKINQPVLSPSKEFMENQKLYSGQIIVEEGKINWVNNGSLRTLAERFSVNIEENALEHIKLGYKNSPRLNGSNFVGKKKFESHDSQAKIGLRGVWKHGKNHLLAGKDASIVVDTEELHLTVDPNGLRNLRSETKGLNIKHPDTYRFSSDRIKKIDVERGTKVYRVSTDV